VKKEKLNGTQAKLGSDYSNELKWEITYLKRTIRSRQK